MEPLLDETGQHRTTAVTVRLEPKILDSLDSISNRLGMKRATIVGYAIGEYVNRMNAQINANETMQRLVIEELLKSFGPQLKALFTEQGPVND
jgi:predicted DNA-binding protein